MRKSREKHGKWGTSEYTTWASMISRCTNPSNKRYKDYGARGIKVCERWRNSFTYFLEDMGSRPDGHTIDRVDNDGNYEPGNCRWATILEQQNNKRDNRSVTYKGETKPVGHWARIFSIDPKIMYRRLIKQGMSMEEAISTPVHDSKVEFNGEKLTIKQWADRSSLTENTINGRLQRGWEFNDILTTPKDFHKDMITYKGEMHNLTRWSKILGVSREVLAYRIKKGWSVDKAFETPINQVKSSAAKSRNRKEAK